MEQTKLEEINNNKDEAYELYLEACSHYSTKSYYAAKDSLKEARKIYDLNDKELFVKIRLLLSRCHRKLKWRMIHSTALEEAEKCAKEAYNHDPSNPEVSVELANVYYDWAIRLKFPLEKFIEEKEKCLYYLESANNGFKEIWQKKLNTVEDKFQKNEALLLEARNFLKNAIRLNPADISYKYRLGVMYYELRYLENFELEAIKLFEEVLLNDVEFKNYYRNKLFERIRTSKTSGDQNGRV